MEKKEKFYKILFTFIAFCLAFSSVSKAQTTNGNYIDWTGAFAPGKAMAKRDGHIIALYNSVLTVNVFLSDNGISKIHFKDLETGKSMVLSPPFFYLNLGANSKVDSKSFIISKKPVLITLEGDCTAVRLSDRLPGKEIRISLINTHLGIGVDWYIRLKDGSNYIQQHFEIQNNTKGIMSVNDIGLSHLPTTYLPENSLGTVPGSPYAIPNSNFLAAIELPGFLAESDSSVTGTWLHLPSSIRFEPDSHYSFTTMLGVFPNAQRRRTFSYYVERERASPLRHYLHYNDWYDLGLNPSDSGLNRVTHAFSEELFHKRGVALDGIVLDDGWDNYLTNLWQFDSTKFPMALTDVKKTAADGGISSLGLWISPFGGYSGQEERMRYAKRHGILPLNAKDFDLSYDTYYQFFKNRCSQLIKDYNIHYLKWDNAAPYENEGMTFGNLQSTAHFLRLCQLSAELRRQDPSVFINTTVGTWPSPFWLNYVDCTWKMGFGGDVNWRGSGDNRERWLNYRDGSIYELVVKRAPLYPLNSMMFHGIVLGKLFQGKTVSLAGNHLKNEVRSYFALGPNLQELYISPDLMDSIAWDDLAEAIKWNVKNAEILYDAHWVKGNPDNFEPYAIAAWKNNKGVLMLRNPNNYARDISIEIGAAFELPVNAGNRYLLKSPYNDQRIQTLEMVSSKKIVLRLLPFEVLVFDANAIK